jgi:hypothetical protein
MSSLIEEWVAAERGRPHLFHLRTSEPLRLRRELLRSGLLRRTTDGDVEFTHPTFRAYLAAATVSVDELPTLVDRSSWRMSLALWASLQGRQQSDRLVDLLAECPLLLGQLIRERAQQRLEITSDEDPQTYFKRFSYFFVQLIREFPLLLRDLPGPSLLEGPVRLVVAESTGSNYVLLWQPSSGDADSVEWVPFAELHELAQAEGWGFPLPVWLLPLDAIRRYHPLELAYLWVVRSLYDLVAFSVWEGGVAAAEFTAHRGGHPAAAHVVNAFGLYRHIASELPGEVRQQLPFNGYEDADLAIEVHCYREPLIVRFALAPAREQGESAVVVSVLDEPAEAKSLLSRGADGTWALHVEGTERQLAGVQEIGIEQLAIQPSGQAAQRWLEEDLGRCLPRFPPEAW